MIKIFKNMIPYWRSILVILGLLVIQAFCDLSLPQYTSSVIDVGILSGGISHILPEYILEDEFEGAKIFMTESERESWEDAYDRENDGIYARRALNEEELDALDGELLFPILADYRMSSMQEDEFKSMLAQAMEKNQETRARAEQIAGLDIEEIENMLHVSLDTHEAEDENGEVSVYVDARPLIRQMLAGGGMGEEDLQAAQESMRAMADSMGASSLHAMGTSYARACNEQAGADMGKIQTDYLKGAGIKMLLMSLLMLMAATGIGYLASKVGAGIGKNLRGAVFEKVVSFSNSEMDQFSTASLITRSTNDIQQIQMVSAVMLRMILYAPVIGIGGIYKVVQTGANMGWIITLAVVLILGFVLLLVRIAMPKFKSMQKLVDALNLVSREILTGLPVIRAFGREQKEEERFDAANKNLMQTQLFTGRVMNFMMPGMMLVMYGITLLIVWVSANRIDAGTLQVGAMTAFITYAMQIVMSFLMLTMMSIMLPRAGVAAERIDEVLQMVPSIQEPAQPLPFKKHAGQVAFSHVHFRYPNAKEDVLKDIDFVARPGKVTAIIGSTGCGKSTLVNLIPRFYDITAGSITIDGEDIRDMALKDLRDLIGFVPQKGVLFSGTIATNLRFGNANASDGLIEEAAGIAQASDFIMEKEDGFESPIAQGGSNVSGGQKQRLAIARAIVKRPAIFIFDDSFSALDMKTDAKLRKALEEKTKDCAVIIVAQRISTILHADQILVLDEGEIVGKGTHTELLKECDVYLQIAKSQLSAKELGLDDSMEKGKEERHE